MYITHMLNVRALRHLTAGLAASLVLLFAAGAFAETPVNGPEPQVNINTASAERLAEVLVGVGLKKAEDIVAYRDAHGAFQDPYELANVSGIGEKLVANNEPRIRVGD